MVTVGVVLVLFLVFNIAASLPKNRTTLPPAETTPFVKTLDMDQSNFFFINPFQVIKGEHSAQE